MHAPECKFDFILLTACNRSTLISDHTGEVGLRQRCRYLGHTIISYLGISWRFHKFQPSQDVVVRKPFRALGSRTLWSFPLWPRDLLDWPNQTLGKIGDAKLWMSKDLKLVETLLHSTGPMESHGCTTCELRITYNGPFQYDTRWSNPGSIWFSFVMQVNYISDFHHSTEMQNAVRLWQECGIHLVQSATSELRESVSTSARTGSKRLHYRQVNTVYQSIIQDHSSPLCWTYQLDGWWAC